MGKIKYQAKIQEFIEKTIVFHISSLQKIIGEKNPYIHLLLHTFVKKRKLFRLTKGWYSTKDDPTLAIFCFKPAYLGLQEALSIHNLWEQETTVIIITTKTIREGIRSLFGENIIIKRTPSAYFFGIEYLPYGESYVPVSDIEKTFLDFFYFGQPLDRDVIREFRKRIDRKKLLQYLRHYDSKIQQKALEALK